MDTKLTAVKPTFIVGPPRCGTTVLLRTLSCLSGNAFAISEPFRIYRSQGKNIISDAFGFAENYSKEKLLFHKFKTRKRPLLDCLTSYRLNACYKETVRFHDFRDPVNRDILELVLSESCNMVGCIRNPVAVVNSVFYRFRSESIEFDLGDKQVKNLVNNLESYLRFCLAFEIPVIRYEDWIEDLNALDSIKDGLRIQESSIDFSTVKYFGIGDALAEKSVNPSGVKNKIFDDAFCKKIYGFAGKTLRDIYPTVRPS